VEQDPKACYEQFKENSLLIEQEIEERVRDILKQI
jgi:hypothetical protein